MFRPLPQRELTALEREWEAKLRAAGEGPPEIRSLYQSSNSDSISIVSIDDVRAICTTAGSVELFGGGWGSAELYPLVNHATAEYWRILADDVHSLPAAYPIFERAFLSAYAESGCATKARKQVGISHTTAWRYLKRFNESRRVKSDNV